MVHIASEWSSFVSSDHLSSVVMLRRLGKQGGDQILRGHMKVLAESDREFERVGAAWGLRMCPAAKWNGPQTT